MLEYLCGKQFGSFLLAQAIFEPTRFPYKYSNILKPSHSSYLSAYEDGTECSETSAYKIQTPGNFPEKAYSKKGTARKYVCMYVGFKTFFYVVWHIDCIVSSLPTGLHLGFFRS